MASSHVACAVWVAAPLWAALNQLAPAQPSQFWQYTLLSGSQLTDECPPCVEPTITQPMRGTFQLRLLQQAPLFSSHTVENLAFTAGTTSGPNYKVVGQGFYQMGGEVVLAQDKVLQVYIQDGQTNRLCYFTNTVATVSRLWPMLRITLAQTNGTEAHTYTLALAAAPLREIWFSSTAGSMPEPGLPARTTLATVTCSRRPAALSGATGI